MNIVITGGAGFLGARTARALLQRQGAQRVSALHLVDRMAAPADLAGDPRVTQAVGDLNDLLAAGAVVRPGTDSVFHLAAAVSAECEADFDLGMRSNYDATRALLDACRAETQHRATQGKAPVRLVFTSSLAVFGAPPGQRLPERVTDTTLPTPQGSYGIQKFIGEQLVADYSRKGFIDGRSVRPLTVCVRPGKPNGAASGFVSGILREPLAGVPAVCPVSPDLPIALASPASTVGGLLVAHDASTDAWGPRTGLNLMALTVTVRDMLAELKRVGGQAAVDLVQFKPDPLVEKLVTGWPSFVDSPRATALGMPQDTSFADVLDAYVRENPGAVRLRA
jgi:nucleoside-diphosphate-sugar epimerase